jgi:hypothetical protein
MLCFSFEAFRFWRFFLGFVICFEPLCFYIRAILLFSLELLGFRFWVLGFGFWVLPNFRQISTIKAHSFKS